MPVEAPWNLVSRPNTCIALECISSSRDGTSVARVGTSSDERCFVGNSMTSFIRLAPSFSSGDICPIYIVKFSHLRQADGVPVHINFEQDQVQVIWCSPMIVVQGYFNGQCHPTNP
jgi:hypothetical protein